MPGKPKLLKVNNRKEVLDLLRIYGTLSITSLSEKCDLSRTTVMKVLSHFVQKGYVRSSGKGVSTDEGGKKPEMYTFNSRFGYVSSLSIHPFAMYCGLFDLAGRMLINMRMPHSENENIKKITENVSTMLLTSIEAANLKTSKLHALIVGCDGLIDPDTGIIRHATHFPSWGNDVPLAELVQCVVGRNVPVLVDNAVRQLGISELHNNPNLKDKKLITIFHGESVSACLLHYGKLERGRRGYVGEIGHMIINPDDKEICNCGNHGCYESMTKRERIINEATMRFNPAEKSSLSQLIMRDKLTLPDIFSAANSGDPFARKLVDWSVKWHTIALHNIILNHDPDIVILQGDYAQGGEYFMSKINSTIRDLKYSQGVKIYSSNTSLQKGFLVGAAFQAIEWLFADDSLYV